MSEPTESNLIPEGSLPRVRISAQSSLDRARQALPEPVDPRAVYVRSLMRSQLRLALLCLAGFLGILTFCTVGLRFLPTFDSLRILGVPLSWWLLGFGPYPLILATAVIYARSARRNESAYRELFREGRSE